MPPAQGKGNGKDTDCPLTLLVFFKKYSLIGSTVLELAFFLEPAFCEDDAHDLFTNCSFIVLLLLLFTPL